MKRKELDKNITLMIIDIILELFSFIMIWAIGIFIDLAREERGASDETG